MELQVVAKKENPLLKRVEITFKAVHKAEATPTRDAIRSELAKQLKAPKEAVVVDRSESSFGRYETRGYAKLYRSKDDALAIERSHILVRNKLKEAEVKEKKEGEKVAAPAKPEKPAAKAEAKPEAPKAEAKPAHLEEKPASKEEKRPAEKHDEKKPAEKREDKKEAKPEAKKAEPKKKEGK